MDEMDENNLPKSNNLCRLTLLQQGDYGVMPSYFSSLSLIILVPE